MKGEVQHKYIMFATNKYTKLYYSLIEKAVKLNLGKGPGRERHHIIPQSLGGDNSKTNLVYISAREHFICHWLLIKMTEGENHSKMLYALHGMKAENKFQARYHTKITSRVYAKYRLEQAVNHSAVMKAKNLIPWNKGGAFLSIDQRKRISEAAKNRPKPSKESVAKNSAARTGLTRSEETKNKISASLKGKPKGPMSLDEKIKRSIANKGKKKPEGHAENVRKANMGVISINLNGIEKKVKKDMLQSWLDQGWKLGGKPRIRSYA